MSDYVWRYKPPRNQRLSPQLYRQAGQPCFFTVRAAAEAAPFRDGRFAEVVVDCLLAQREKSRCQVDVYCLMPDHLHLVVTPAVNGASSLEYVDRLKGWSTRVLRQGGWQGRVWQPRSYDHLVRADEDLQRIADYILANPVRKGLCTYPEEYPWSGIPIPVEMEPRGLL